MTREFTARELGFVDSKGQPKVTTNSMDAVADRDVFIEFLSAAALCGVHTSRVAEDLILWSSAEFRFAALPRSLHDWFQSHAAEKKIRMRWNCCAGNPRACKATCKPC